MSDWFFLATGCVGGVILTLSLLLPICLRRLGRIRYDSERTGLNALVEPIRGDLNSLLRATENARLADVADNARLRQQFADEMKRLHSVADRVGDDARGLRAALTGNVNIRGLWGESQLEQILISSGLVRDVHYSRQVMSRDVDCSYRPDFVLFQPDGSRIVIDSKAIFPDYSEYMTAESSEKQKSALARHIQAIRSAVRELAAKRYETRVEKSVDFVLMFIPVEGAYQAAMAAAPETFNEALTRRVMIVGPSSLIVVLTIISRMWRQQEQDRNTGRILSAATELANRTMAFGDELEKVGRSLEAAKNAYAAAIRRLTEEDGRTRSVGNSLRELAKLGLKPTREYSECFGSETKSYKSCRTDAQQDS